MRNITMGYIDVDGSLHGHEYDPDHVMRTYLDGDNSTTERILVADGTEEV